MADQITVLVAGVYSSGAINVIRSLRAAGCYRVLAVDSHEAPTGVFAAERGFRLPEPAADGCFGEALAALCAREQVRIVLPGNSAYGQHLMRCQEALQQAGTMVLAGTLEFARLCANKWLTHLFIEQHNFPSLRTYLPLARDRAEAEIGYPMLVKPCEDPGNCPAIKVRTPKELDTCLEQNSTAGWGSVLQEYIGHEEGEFTATVLLSRAGGRVLATTIGRWLKTGSARAFALEDHPAVRKVVEAQAAASRSRGPLTFQGRVRDGRFYTFAINPRFANPTMAYTLAGFNEVDAAVRHFLTGDAPVVPVLPPQVAVMFPEYRMIPADRYQTWCATNAVDGEPAPGR